MWRTFVAFAVLSGQAAVSRAEEKPKLAVLDLQATGVEPELIPTLTEILTVEIDSIGKHKVIAGRDIQSMLGFEKQKDLVGCTDASCLAEIGGALGVEMLVVGHIGKVGSTYVVNIKLINIRKAETESRVYETVRGEVDTLIESVRSAAHKLLASAAGELAPKVAAPQPVPAPPVVAQAPTPSPRVVTPTTTPAAPKAPIAPPTAPAKASGSRIGWGTITLWSVGGAALLAGAGMGIRAKSLEHKANNTLGSSGSGGTVYDVGTQRYASDAHTAATVANVAYAVGVVAVGSGFLTWLLAGPEPTTTVLAPAISANQIGLALAHQF
jgi:hypothetical protein